MEYAIEALIPYLADKVGALLAPSSSPSDPTVVLPSDSNNVRPLPISVPSPLSTPKAPRPSSSVTLPFQHLYYDLTGTESGTTSTTVVELSSIKSLIKYYRNARLVSVEAVLFATSNSVSTPVTIDLVWTTADVTATDILSTPGGVRFTLGGLNVTNGGELPCPLDYINPIIKAPLSFSDSPRLCVKFHKISDKNNSPKLGVLLIRGKVSVDTPAVYVKEKSS